MNFLRIVNDHNTTTIFMILLVMFCLFAFSAFQQSVIAQELATTTPAPSKTPTSRVTEANVNRTPQVTSTPVPFIEPFTQADLTVLTGNVQRPNGLTFYNDKLYVSCSGDWTLYEIDAESGATSQFIYGIRNAHTLYAEASGSEMHLWIPDFQNNNLILVRRGVPTTIASSLDGPWGIDQIDDDRFAVTSLLGNRLVLIGRDTQARDALVGLRSPTGVVVDGDFTYVGNTGSARRAIEWFDSAAIFDSEGDTLDADDESVGNSLVSGLQNVTNLAMGQDGLLYFSYALGTRGVVGRVDPEVCMGAGGCTHDQVEIVIYTELAAPLAGLTISPDMRLYMHSIFSPDIYWVQLDNTES